ncbi:MAG TPA: DnaJ domain-containing protein [Mycobacteriales bacterium]|nr:DnaJ domain-containing protein [Mycobacteriales bacterium]
MTRIPSLGPDGDPYGILGLDPDASDEEIATAYRRLLRQHHPDTSEDTAEPGRLEEILAAYRILKSRKFQPPPRARGVSVPVRHHHSGATVHTGRMTDRPRHNSGARRRIPITGRGTDTAAAITITAAAARTGTMSTVAVPAYPTGLHNIRIRIPPGTSDGQTVRIPGHGWPGRNGGPPGDLHLTVYHR